MTRWRFICGLLSMLVASSAWAESDRVLVANQYGGAGCPHNQNVVIANPFTGALVEDLGRPNSAFGNINEAKPFDLNRKVVALWGGSTDFGQTPGVGVYDLEVGAWISSFALPSTWELGANSPHSIAVLPDGYFAIAQVGHIGGTGSGYVVIVSPTGTVGQKVPLTSAHGVEWDGQRGHLFAAGGASVKQFSYSTSTKQLTLVNTWTLPTDGGHDLRRRRVDNDFFVTTNTQAYIFRPEATTKFTSLGIGGGVKQIDQRFDGLGEWNYWKDDYFRFLDGRSPVPYQFCHSPYKGGRWLWPPGQKVYPEDTALPVCGDGVCNGSETCSSCAVDCGSCPSGLVLGDFEGSVDGWERVQNVTNFGVSSWSATVATGSYSLWNKYDVPAAWAESQIRKVVNANLSGYSALRASVYPKTPTVSGPAVKARFLVQGSDNNWYSGSYQTLTLNTRNTLTMSLSGVPRNPLKQVYITWQYTTNATGVDNELWVDHVRAE